MAIFINFLLTVFVIVALLLILVVLMQRPKSEGLGAAFGGGMTENLFGAQTTNVLANFTRYLGGIFFALALLLSVLYAKHSRSRSAIQQDIIKTAKPVVPMSATSPAASPSAATSPVPLTPEKTSTPAPAIALPVATPEISPSVSATVTPKLEASPSPSVAQKPMSAHSAPSRAKR